MSSYTQQVREALQGLSGEFTMASVAAAAPDLPRHRVSIALRNMANAGELLVSQPTPSLAGGQVINIYTKAPKLLDRTEWDGPTGIAWERGAKALGRFIDTWPASAAPSEHAQ